MNRRVFGVVGPMASGKGEIIHQLEGAGFQTYSLSQILKATLEEWRLPVSRQTLQDLGDFLRLHGGDDYLAERTVELILESPYQNIAIDSIRHPEEIMWLKQIFDINILGVTASPEKQFELIKKRGRDGDPTTWEEFTALAQRDLGEGQPSHGQQVEACLQLALLIIENNGTFSEYQEKVESILRSFGIEGQTPRKEAK